MAKNKTTTTRVKARAKAKAKAKPRAPKQAVAARKAKGATPAKAAKRPSVKPRRTSVTAVGPRRSKVIAAVEPQRIEPDLAVTEAAEVAVAVDAIVDEGSGAAKKPGALARLKSGVGNLFARMTGRANQKDSPRSDGVPRDDRTMEIVTGDIILQRDVDAPSRSAKGGRKKPPPPPSPSVETSED